MPDPWIWTLIGLLKPVTNGVSKEDLRQHQKFRLTKSLSSQHTAFPFHESFLFRASFEGVTPWTLTSKETLLFFCHWILLKNLLCSYFWSCKNTEQKSASCNCYPWVLILCLDRPNPYSLPCNTHSNNWISAVVGYVTKLVEFHDASLKGKLSWIMKLQYGEGLRACTPSHGFEVCG